MANPELITHITNTKTSELHDVYFEDIDALVSSKKEAWLVYTFLWRYFSTEKAAQAFVGNAGAGK